MGIDAKDGMVATHGWANVTDIKAVDLAKSFRDAGVSSLVYTDSIDGMMQGVNVEQTVNLARDGGLPVIASGGDLQDIENLKPYSEYLASAHHGSCHLWKAPLISHLHRLCLIAKLKRFG